MNREQRIEGQLARAAHRRIEEILHVETRHLCAYLLQTILEPENL